MARNAIFRDPVSCFWRSRKDNWQNSGGGGFRAISILLLVLINVVKRLLWFWTFKSVWASLQTETHFEDGNLMSMSKPTSNSSFGVSVFRLQVAAAEALPCVFGFIAWPSKVIQTSCIDKGGCKQDCSIAWMSIPWPWTVKFLHSKWAMLKTPRVDYDIMLLESFFEHATLIHASQLTI